MDWYVTGGKEGKGVVSFATDVLNKSDPYVKYWVRQMWGFRTCRRF